MSKLQTYLRESGITQRDFAARIGVTPGTMSKICAYKTGVTLGTALRIEKATGGKIRPSDLVEDDAGKSEREARQ